MHLRYSLKTAVTGLRTNKSRSALTILGIVIGITAIILVMSVSSGARNLILGEINSLGSATIRIAPGKETEGPSALTNLFTDSLKVRDYEALQKKNNVPNLEKIMPVVLVPGGNTEFEGKTYNGQTFGSSEVMTEMMDLKIGQGNFFDETDVRQLANVVVIGDKVKNELFGESDALNQKIKIKGKNFRIVGIFEPTGSSIFFNVDDVAVIPYTTAQTYLTGTNYFNEMIVRATTEDLVDETVQNITATLRETHGIDNPENDDFSIVTQKDLAKRVGTVTAALAALLSAVAAISLIVGGVGIMNIMLVSVTERTREIGLRKALGATYRDILRQFLFESVLLTVIGGIVGIILGALFSFLTAKVLSISFGLNWQFALPISSVLLGIGVSAVVGLIFGLYPARKAARKSPIEALRFE